LVEPLAYSHADGELGLWGTQCVNLKDISNAVTVVDVFVEVLEKGQTNDLEHCNAHLLASEKQACMEDVLAGTQLVDMVFPGKQVCVVDELSETQLVFPEVLLGAVQVNPPPKDRVHSPDLHAIEALPDTHHVPAPQANPLPVMEALGVLQRSVQERMRTLSEELSSSTLHWPTPNRSGVQERMRTWSEELSSSTLQWPTPIGLGVQERMRAWSGWTSPNSLPDSSSTWMNFFSECQDEAAIVAAVESPVNRRRNSNADLAFFSCTRRDRMGDAM